MPTSPGGCHETDTPANQSRIRKEYEEWAGVKEPEKVTPEEELKNCLLARDVDSDELWGILERCYGVVALSRLYNQSLCGFKGTIPIGDLQVHKWTYSYEWEYVWGYFERKRIEEDYALYLLAYKLGIDEQLRETQCEHS